jgi:hypothetical protein
MSLKAGNLIVDFAGLVFAFFPFPFSWYLI